MDYLSFATNNSTLQTSNCGQFVVLQEPQQFQRQFPGFNGFHCLNKSGCDQNGFRSFSSFETNDRVDPRANRNDRKRSLDNHFGSDEIKRKKVSTESESVNNGIDEALVEHGLELQRLNVDSHLLPNESGHQNLSDDCFDMDTNGFSNIGDPFSNGVHPGLGFVPAVYNTSSLEHEKTVDAVMGYDSLYLYNSMIAEMHGC